MSEDAITGTQEAHVLSCSHGPDHRTPTLFPQFSITIVLHLTGENKGILMSVLLIKGEGAIKINRWSACSLADHLPTNCLVVFVVVRCRWHSLCRRDKKGETGLLILQATSQPGRPA